MQGQRLTFIDLAKGFAILMVVEGHLVQFNFHGDSANTVFNFIYSFHMPLLFFLSGYVAALKRDTVNWGNAINFISKKIQTLLIPFFVWGVLVSLIKMDDYDIEKVSNLIMKLLVKPDNGGAWFLITLFFIQINYLIMCLISNKYVKYRLLTEFVVCVFITAMQLGWTILTHESVYFNPYYNISFFSGYLFSRYYNGDLERILVMIAFILFCWLSIHYDFKSSPATIKMITGIISSFVVLFVAKKFVDMNKNHANNIITEFGRHSLEIYLTHFIVVFVFKNSIDSDSFSSESIFIISLVVSLFIAYISMKFASLVSTVPIMSILLYGKKS